MRCYQLHLTESGVQPPTLNSSASALRFFFGTTLDRAELARHLARVHYPRKLPRVLSPEEVGRLLEANGDGLVGRALHEDRPVDDLPAPGPLEPPYPASGRRRQP